MNLRFSRKQLGIPYAVFLICFVVAPLLVVLYYAFTNGSGQFTAGNFINFFTDENTIGTLCYSLVVAATVTVCCTLVAYPVALILPLYTTLGKLDNSFLEAAADLGADPVRTFLKVTLPLSVPGLISGVTMVFLPSMTNYVILDMLYNSTYIMGSLIGSYFNAYDWHSGSMISIVLLAIIFLVTWATNGFSEEETGRGTIL